MIQLLDSQILLSILEKFTYGHGETRARHCCSIIMCNEKIRSNLIEKIAQIVMESYNGRDNIRSLV